MQVPPSKLRVPRPLPHTVPRPRVEALLDRAPADALVLITAPAGYGKTVLLADWARRRSERQAESQAESRAVSWLSLDEDDDAPARFWPALVAALAAGLPDAGPDRLLAGVTGRWADRTWLPGDEVEFLADLLDVGARSPVEIVLDGTEHLHDRRILDGLRLLLRTPQRAVRLVLAGRVDPALPVARLRVEDRLCELRADVLRFTVEECDRLLRDAGLRLDRAQVELLHTRTGGWAAGIRLAALRLRDHPDPARFLGAFPADERAVADFLDTEILVHLSAEERDLLSRVSVADPVPAALAVALSDRPDAADVLDRIAHRTGLLTATGTGHAEYRTQTLLRSYLSIDLERHGRDGVDVLHERAARWWTDHDHPVEALRHARLAGASRLRAGLLDRWAVTLAARGEHAPLLDEAAAPDTGGPWLSSSVAVARLARGDLPGASAALRPASRGTDDRAADLRAYRIAVERLCGAPAPPPGRDERMPDEPALAAIYLLGRGTARLFTGVPGEPDLYAALALARTHDLAFVSAHGQNVLAVADWLRGDLARSVERAAAGLDGAARGGWGGSPWTGAARAAAAHAQLLRGRPSAARALASCAGPTPWPPAVRFALAAVRGAARFDDGDREAGLEEMRHARVGLGPVPAPRAVCAAAALLEHQAALAVRNPTAAATALGWLAARAPGTAELTLARARTEVAAGRADRARETVGPLRQGAGAPALPWTVVDAWLVDADAACRLGDRTGARRSLRTALALAERCGAVRPFAVLTGEAAEVVTEVLSGLDLSSGFPVHALTARGRHTSAVPVGFSGRELDVLVRLPSLLGLDDIAGELGVSVNTVKTHLRSIYLKLGVTSRRAAVLAAHELGALA